MALLIKILHSLILKEYFLGEKLENLSNGQVINQSYII